MSKEKQIEEMAEFIGHNTPIYPHLYYYTAEILYNAGYRKQSEWISVDERLPDGDGKFLIVDDEGYMLTASWYNGMGWFLPVCRGNSITHWMPLPSAPDMKGGAE